MLSWLQPFLRGGRLVIHVMDSLDSLAAAGECKSPLAAEAEQRHRLNGRVNTGFEPKLGAPGACGDSPAHEGQGWGLSWGLRGAAQMPNLLFPPSP